MAKRSNAQRGPQGSIRIIAGEWRSRRLSIPEGTTVRPTPDRVRETLFNWLRDSIEGARCLDLCAGSGALGFEALSRGAAQVYFVERDPQLVESLRMHAASFGVSPRIIRQNAESFLRSVVDERFDVVFVDPPYESPLDGLLELLPRWVNPDAVIYVERKRTPGLPQTELGTWIKRGTAGAVEYGLLQLVPVKHDPQHDAT